MCIQLFHARTLLRCNFYVLLTDSQELQSIDTKYVKLYLLTSNMHIAFGR